MQEAGMASASAQHLCRVWMTPQGAGPMVRGPTGGRGGGGGRLQVPHVEAGCEKEAAQLLLVPKVTRPAQSYLTGHLLPSEATRV